MTMVYDSLFLYHLPALNGNFVTLCDAKCLQIKKKKLTMEQIIAKHVQILLLS